MSWTGNSLQTDRSESQGRGDFGAQRGGESGQALIELSIGMALLVIILLGGVQFGQIMYTWIKVSNAAKAGVQYGTQNPYTVTDTAGIQAVAMQAASSLTGLTATSSHACVCSDGTASNCNAGTCATSHLVDTLTVNTSYALTTFLRIPGFTNSFTLTGKAVQRRVQ